MLSYTEASYCSQISTNVCDEDQCHACLLNVYRWSWITFSIDYAWL